jgi:hypothetical protein
MAEKFRAGEAVEWNSHGNMARGKVKKKLTSRTLIKGHAVAASPDNPELPADTDSGPLAAQQPETPRESESLRS